MSADDLEEAVLKLRGSQMRCMMRVAENWNSTSMMAQWTNQALNFQAAREALGDKAKIKMIKGGTYVWE